MVSTTISMSDLSGREMTRITPPKPFQRSFCVCLDGVFSAEECETLIKHSESIGYEKALIDAGDGRQELAEDVRNSDRCMIDDAVVAAEIFRRVRHAVPEQYKGHAVRGLNERLRFLRYDPGQFFKPHYDGAYMTLARDQRSRITLQLYLNEGFEGGETTFLSTLDNVSSVPFVPRTGSVLLFEHEILHEGSDVRGGRKYVIRTDVMYATAWLA